MILYTGILAMSGLQFKAYLGKNRNHGVSEITIVVARVPVGMFTEAFTVKHSTSIARVCRRGSVM